MTISKTFLLATALVIGAASLQPAMAEDGRNGAAAAGAIGGLAAGAIIGGALSNNNSNGDDGEGRRYRRRHAYSQERRQVRVCHIERRRTENEDGDVFIRRVRVCE